MEGQRENREKRGDTEETDVHPAIVLRLARPEFVDAANQKLDRDGDEY